MCGICGVFNLDGAPANQPLVDRMSSAISHRGPDGSGSYVSGSIGLGHRRLSIIDLEGGAQPLSSEDGKLQVVFNGEIYNFVELREELSKCGHIFRTRSDTEVIIHGYKQWGLDVVNRFNGIFAFALWDDEQKQLFLARDHLGVKPLYYVVLGKRLLFASEIKALLVDPECPKQVNLRALSQLFTLRYVPSPGTLFDRINKLPPAHLMVVDSGGIKISRYWSNKPRVKARIDEAQAVETYQSLLEDAVRLQMRSDVPVGLFLSSGIDSSALLAIMGGYVNQPVHTFTIGFEEGEKSNETDDARQIANQYGADHTEMIVGPKDYEKYYERYLGDLEEPVGNESAAAFYFVSLIASRKVKVALAGQGADEPWAGYDRYRGVKLSQYYSRLPNLVTDRMVRPLVERFVRNEKLRRAAESLDEIDLLSRFVKIYSFYTSAMKGNLFQPWILHEVSANGIEAREALGPLQGDVAGLDPISQMLYIDTRANLPDDLLMVADKTAMANSLEARVPYLDYRIVEFVESLPPGFKLKGLRGKYLHKNALRKWLPRDVIRRKKKGFANPVDRWLRASMRRYVGDCLLSDHSAVRRYFNQDYIRTLVSQHELGNQNYLRHIYLLISFELWHQRFLRA
jgi:asparagine synthase (glutamine-hydrolysing)